MYQTSQFARTVVLPKGGTVVYHSLIGNPAIVDDGGVELLGVFRKPHSLLDLRTDYDIDTQTENVIATLIECGLLIVHGEDQREVWLADIDHTIQQAALGNNLEVLDLSVSERCNFGCTYCIHARALDLDFTRAGKTGFMSEALAKQAIDSFLRFIRQIGKKEWRLHLGSAEALLNFKVVRWVMDYLGQIEAIPVDVSINSNLSLLTEEMAIFFRDHNIRVNTSIDGLPHVNDTIRVYKDGRGTSADIVRSIRLIQSVGHRVNGIGVTLCDANFDAVDEAIVDWLVELNIPNVLFDIDSVNIVNLDVEEAAKKFVLFESECRKVGIRVDGCWKTAYENIRDSGISGAKGFCSSLMGNNIAVAPSGNMYYCTYSATPVGHIDDFPGSLWRGLFGQLLSDSFMANFPECSGCDIEGHCLGGCLLTREGDKNQQKKVEQMCAFYRSATSKLLMLDAEESS